MDAEGQLVPGSEAYVRSNFGAVTRARAGAIGAAVGAARGAAGTVAAHGGLSAVVGGAAALVPGLGTARGMIDAAGMPIGPDDVVQNLHHANIRKRKVGWMDLTTALFNAPGAKKQKVLGDLGRRGGIYKRRRVRKRAPARRGARRYKKKAKKAKTKRRYKRRYRKKRYRRRR